LSLPLKVQGNRYSGRNDAQTGSAADHYATARTMPAPIVNHYRL
jgi:hypothetical protein